MKIATWLGYTIIQEGAGDFAVKRGGMVHGRYETAWKCIEAIDRGFK